MLFAGAMCFLAIATMQVASQYQDQYGFGRNRALNQFPAIRMPQLNFPPLPQAPLFTPEDIINNRFGGPGVNFNGIAVSSSSSAKTDRFGNVIRNGGTKVITNDNGVVKEYSYGDPSNTENIIVAGLNTPRIPQPIFPIPRVRPVDPDMLTNYKPGRNEQFQGRSIVSYHHSSNINGDKTAGGVATIVDNDNGRVNKKTYKYGDLNDEGDY